MLIDLGVVPAGHALVLAQNPTPPPDQGPEFGKASPIGLVVILLLFIATVLLIRSMTKHLRRVPASFDAPLDPAGPAPDGPDREPGADPAPRRPDAGATER